MKKRASGILLHPTSLAGKYGMGALGNEAKAFIDFLHLISVFRVMRAIRI